MEPIALIGYETEVLGECDHPVEIYSSVASFLENGARNRWVVVDARTNSMSSVKQLAKQFYLNNRAGLFILARRTPTNESLAELPEVVLEGGKISPNGAVMDLAALSRILLANRLLER